MAADASLMEKIVSLCKRRGFIYPSSEIYGGIGGFWDYGPLGVELKRNVKEAWWRDMVTNAPVGLAGDPVSILGVDCTIIMNPRVWQASGHVGGFSDPMVDCRECKARLRADQVLNLTLYPDGTIENWQDLMAGGAASVRLGATDAPRTLVGVEPGQQPFTEAAAEAVTACAKKNNIGFLKKFRILEEGGPGKVTAFVAEDSRGNRLQGVVQPLLDAEDPTAATCPRCQSKQSLTAPREFNLMFQTHVGALQDSSSVAYLRPETAQGIFVNYVNVLDTSRVKLPFGIAQIGKAFRNEINPKNFTFRSREFEQMEIEFFCRDEDSMRWYEFWRNARYQWYVDHNLKSEKLRLRDQEADELAHYSRACADIEYLFPFADDFQELEGVAHRGCYDLEQHQKHSGRDLTYFDDDLWEQDRGKFGGDKDAEKQAKSKPPYRFLPTVIEPSAGVDRAALAFLCEAYTEDEAPNDKGKMEKRTVMKFHPRLAPIKAAFFPLVNKDGMPEIARKLYLEARKNFNAFYDQKGAIGRRYRRQDEAGTPYCITVDGETLTDNTVTVRDRDTLAQERVPTDSVLSWLRARIQA